MAFEQHAVPQNIASYHFRLVGDMTLKQFFELAAGAIVGLMFYAAPLPALIRWPLIAISILFGAALAFLPIQDRPLEIWVMAFIKAIYSPTVFMWNKNSKVFFKQDAASSPATPPTTQAAKPSTGEPQKKKPPSQSEAVLDQAEQARLEKISKAIEEHHRGEPTPTTQQGQKAISDQQQSITIPNEQPESTPKTTSTPDPQPKPSLANTNTAGTQKAQAINQPLTGHTENTNTQSAQFSESANPPANPHTPNTVAGQVIGNDGKIIENAILEVNDKQGRPVRALKSNTAGHFYIVTPLLDGEYTINADKEGYKFQPVKFEAKSEIIPPIIIKPTN